MSIMTTTEAEARVHTESYRDTDTYKAYAKKLDRQIEILREIAGIKGDNDE